MHHLRRHVILVIGGVFGILSMPSMAEVTTQYDVDRIDITDVPEMIESAYEDFVLNIEKIEALDTVIDGAPDGSTGALGGFEIVMSIAGNLVYAPEVAALKRDISAETFALARTLAIDQRRSPGVG